MSQQALATSIRPDTPQQNQDAFNTSGLSSTMNSSHFTFLKPTNIPNVLSLTDVSRLMESLPSPDLDESVFKTAARTSLDLQVKGIGQLYFLGLSKSLGEILMNDAKLSGENQRSIKCAMTHLRDFASTSPKEALPYVLSYSLAMHHLSNIADNAMRPQAIAA